ncbi:molybdate ABC transporter substrate-binding protein [uncultured Eudoraea sp.]|uniref:molybdate ABC transporter substrate-binding protein n=1 Tax=uncultured Eudoraea sp. TaxID=1035614 RepID=UPI002620715C|nr:molybdate ABC transporter substrate-binding protein [uncultured Eudoraea sp.]
MQIKNKGLSRISILFLTLIISCNGATKESSKVTIAASANMQYALGPITEKFIEKTGIPCQLILGSSGKHTAQIMEGAPFDVFVSADMKYPTKLYDKGLTTAPPEIYAYGKLVLWTMVDELPLSMAKLNDSSINHIALANPKTAPYGQAAVEVLEKHALLDRLKNKLVYGESIGQTNQFIYSESAEIGFTAQSVVLAPEMKGKGKWILVNDTDYKPISQGAVVIKQSEGNNHNANKFYNFLFSNEARIILKDFGYSVDE